MATYRDTTDLLADGIGLSEYSAGYIYAAYPGTLATTAAHWAPGEIRSTFIEARAIWATAPEPVTRRISAGYYRSQPRVRRSAAQAIGRAVAARVHDQEATDLDQFGRPGRDMAEHIDSSPLVAAVREIPYTWIEGRIDSGWGRYYTAAWREAINVACNDGHRPIIYMGESATR